MWSQPCRQCQAVCRRWRSVWFSCPGLWRILRLFPFRSVDSQLAIVKRVAPLVERLEIIGTKAVGAAGSTQQFSVVAMLSCFPAGRWQRLQVFRLTTDPYRPPRSVEADWELHKYKSLTAADLRQVGRLDMLRALELDSWQLPHCTAQVLGRLTQLSRLRLRARQLPPGCLPGAINELKQLESLELDTAVELPEEGTAQLSALSALTRLLSHVHVPPCSQGTHRGYCTAIILPPHVASRCCAPLLDRLHVSARLLCLLTPLSACPSWRVACITAASLPASPVRPHNRAALSPRVCSHRWCANSTLLTACWCHLCWGPCRAWRSCIYRASGELLR